MGWTLCHVRAENLAHAQFFAIAREPPHVAIFTNLNQAPNNAHSPGLDASMAKKQVEWYQSGDFVTASLKLRPVRPPQTRGEIKAEFHEQHCAVYEGGKHTF